MTSPDTFLGIDIGTSGVKAVLVGADGVLAGQAQAPLEISRPHANWSEQNPADWWRATNEAVGKLDPALRRTVRGVGLSGQMHGATLLGADDKPLRQAILWNDGRSAAQCTELERRVPASRTITGNLAMPGFTAPKLIWVAENEPDVFAATRTVLLPKDYVRLCMTGDKATDLSDAAGTLWVDVGARTWSDNMLAATGLSLEHMPALYEGSAGTGQLSAKVAADWGMDSVPVAAGGGDNAAGAVGAGVVEPGQAMLSLGTSGVVFLATDRFLPYPQRAVHAFCHALPGQWHQMSVMLSAAACIDWAARLTGTGDAGALVGLAETRGRLDGGELFLPYLSGERTPHNAPQARGVLFGLDHDSDPAAIGQAVIEGVAFGLADGVQALVDSGAKLDSLSVIGGGARSAWWGRILAAAIQRPLVYRDSSEVGPAFGAARLARLAVTGEAVEAVCPPPAVRAVVEPRDEDVAILASKHARFSSLYKSISSEFTPGPDR